VQQIKLTICRLLGARKCVLYCIALYWVVVSSGPKEAQVQSYSPGGANVPWWEARWCHLANTTEPSVCCGDAALCQIISTICFNYCCNFKEL